MKKILLAVSLFVAFSPLNVFAQNAVEIDIAKSGEHITLDKNEIEFEVKSLPNEPIYSVMSDYNGNNNENILMPDAKGITTHFYTDLVPNLTYVMGFTTDLKTKDGIATVKEDAKLDYTFEFTYVTEQTMYEDDDAKYVFKEFEVLDGTMLADKILAIEIEFTNKKNVSADPWMQFVLDFVGEQETDTQIFDLMGANGEFAPDYKSNEVANSKIDVKAGATVNVVVGFSLEGPELPVFIRNRNFMGENGAEFELKVTVE